MKDALPPLEAKMVLEIALALLLAVRCKQKDAAKQLLAKIYHEFSEQQARTTLNRLIYLLEPQERDWMKNLV